MKNNFLPLWIGLMAGLLACTGPGNEQKQSRPTIVCTTNILGDVVSYLAGDSLEVQSLMGPGVDPHLYKATQGDVSALSQADLIVYNGLHLEGKMTEILEKLPAGKVYEAASALDTARLINTSGYADAYDPHIWFDPLLWSQAVSGISGHLQKRYPSAASHIKQREQQFMMRLQALHHYSDSLLQLIPDSQRVLITAHDAFTYFGESFQVEVRALQGISTAAEYGIHDVNTLVDYIVSRRIKAVFIENSIPARSIEAVIAACEQKGHSVRLGGELYSDALGEAGSEAGTYLGMFQYNVETIAEALR